MKRELEIQLMMDDLVKEQKIDFYSNSNRDLLSKLKKRTALEYAEYLRYEIERLEEYTDIKDFIEYEILELIKEKYCSFTEEEDMEIAIKYNLCSRVLEIIHNSEQ